MNKKLQTLSLALLLLFGAVDTGFCGSPGDGMNREEIEQPPEEQQQEDRHINIHLEFLLIINMQITPPTPADIRAVNDITIGIVITLQGWENSTHYQNVLNFLSSDEYHVFSANVKMSLLERLQPQITLINREELTALFYSLVEQFIQDDFENLSQENQESFRRMLNAES